MKRLRNGGVVSCFLAQLDGPARIGPMHRNLAAHLRFVGPRTSAAVVCVLGIVWSTQVSAQSGSLVDNLGTREIAMGESMRADARGILATSINPAGLALSREIVVEGSYGYRPRDAASVFTAAGCDSTTTIAACYYYRFFNSETPVGDMDFNRRAHELGISTARALTPQLSIGINSRYFDYNSSMMGESDTSGFTFDVGAIIKAANTLNIGLVGYNVFGEDSPRYPLGIGAGAIVRVSPALSFGADGLWNLDADDSSKGRYGGGAEYFLSTANGQQGYPIRIGSVYDSRDERTFVTGGIGLTTVKMGIDIAARRELSGSKETMIHASLRLFGPRLAAQAPRYAKPTTR